MMLIDEATCTSWSKKSFIKTTSQCPSVKVSVLAKLLQRANSGKC